ncbi:MAG TPA: polysaccharide deacetylase family protein [Acidobacteriota bacterium]|nr:polysaccharide deacetylase family protein [Acidobacteriota bacterium]
MSPSLSSLVRPAAAGLRAVGADGVLRAIGDRGRLERGPRGRRWVPRPSRPFQILIYHRVRPGPSPFAIDAIPPERFARQMEHLARHFRVLPLEELRRRAEERSVPPRAIAVTFDDGYADNHEFALPILARLGLPATVFVVTGCVGTGVAPWHDRVLRAFERTPLREALLPWSDELVAFPTEPDRRAAAFRTLAFLKPMAEEERLAAVSRLDDTLEIPEEARGFGGLMLDWDQVRGLHRRGVAIGSHTVTHPILSRVAPDRIRSELVDSKRAIEEAVGEPATLFAYPNGRPEDYTAEVVAALDCAGYRVAVTTSFGTNEPGDDPLRWRRGTPWEPDLPRFALKLAYYRLAGETGAPRPGPASPSATAPTGGAAR